MIWAGNMRNNVDAMCLCGEPAEVQNEAGSFVYNYLMFGLLNQGDDDV
jgi:pyrrolidone-carboxylate peptidase